MNIAVIVLVALCVILALYKIITDKKKGKNGCNNSCSDCPYSNNCNIKNG
ncbi:MAG: FeoB-associated Cys-rich membrane protein [Eubacterium sp.]|nr:FeoB-associated Cys-rich membrane protein [Eubacterium sp.]